MQNVLKLFNRGLYLEFQTPSGRTGVKKRLDKRYKYPCINFYMTKLTFHEDLSYWIWDVLLDYEENIARIYGEDFI